MIQTPQMQYIPQQSFPIGYQQQQGIYPPVQYQNAQNQQGAIYNYPVTSSYLPAAPKPKPQYNGVNLEILNPQGQGGLGAPNQGVQAAQAAQSLNHAQYNGVNIEILNPQGQGGFGAFPPNVMPAQFYPIQQPPLNIPQYPPFQPIGDSQPQLAQQNNLPVINPPAPNIPGQDTQAPQNVPNPVINGQQTSTPPVIDAPTQQTSNVNPETFAGKLNTDDLDAQKAVIEDIAEKVKNSDVDGPVLLDTQIFDALVNIINKDTSSLQGPTQEIIELRQKKPEELTADEQQLAGPTPFEKAGINKQFSLYTIAYMQERLNNELEKRNGSALELKDLPCINTIVDTAKSNQDPDLRKSALTCLSYIARPEYAQDLNTIFELAKNDEDDSVSQAAVEAIDNLNNKFANSNSQSAPLEGGYIDYVNSQNQEAESSQAA